MNIFADIRTLVIETLDAMVADGRLPSGLSWGAVAVEPPRDAGHGDMATNAAMVLAKPAGCSRGRSRRSLPRGFSPIRASRAPRSRGRAS
jgi:arginyl-tRNA synthetase